MKSYIYLYTVYFSTFRNEKFIQKLVNNLNISKQIYKTLSYQSLIKKLVLKFYLLND